MAKNNGFVDDAGRKVIDFAASCRTLGKVGELADNIRQMAESGAWRRYRTAVGEEAWLECEFDYFLISCDLEYDDVYRTIKWDRLGEKARAMMDHDAPPDKRRPLDQAAATYRAAGPETLLERAARLNWVSKTGKPRLPFSSRLRKEASIGKTLEKQALERRKQRLTQRQRHDLDQITRELAARLDADEIRYLIDGLATRVKRPRGQPSRSHAEWVRDVAELDGDTRALARRWNLSESAVRVRKTRLALQKS